MRTIHKFELRETECSVVMPRNAHIISVQSVAEHWLRHAIFIWAEVDDELPCEVRDFRVITTGEELPKLSLRYIGSCIIGKSNGDYPTPVNAVHVYEHHAPHREVEA